MRTLLGIAASTFASEPSFTALATAGSEWWESEHQIEHAQHAERASRSSWTTCRIKGDDKQESKRG